MIELEIFNLSKMIPKKSKNISSKMLISPMPGQVVKICVSENQKVNSRRRPNYFRCYENGKYS